MSFASSHAAWDVEIAVTGEVEVRRDIDANVEAGVVDTAPSAHVGVVPDVDFDVAPGVESGVRPNLVRDSY